MNPTSAMVLTAGLRWAARLLALLLAGGVLLLAVGEGFNPAKLTPSALALSVPFFIAWVGLWLGWRWPGLGGILVVAGVLGFYLVHWVERGRFPNGSAFLLMAIPGGLFLLCWLLPGRNAPPPTSRE
jgi:hypothetical protein